MSRPGKLPRKLKKRLLGTRRRPVRWVVRWYGNAEEEREDVERALAALTILAAHFPGEAP